MPYKIMMSIVCIVPLIFSIAFVAIPEFFILESYPNAEGLALEIGITQRYVMAGMLFIVLCLLFQSRNVEKVDNQKEILLGVAIGFAVMCAIIILMEGPGRGLPLLVPPVIATGTIAILSFWSRSKLS
jgi:amino acid transporter